MMPCTPSHSRLRGLIAAAFTPMHADGALNLDAIPRITEHLVTQGVHGVFVCGTTGEGASLSTSERCVVADAYIEAVGMRLPVIIHVGHNSLSDACALAAHAERSGADAIGAGAPSYFRPDSVESLVACLAEIAGAAPRTPLYFYHIPRLTGVHLDVARLVRAAADRIPTFAGVKYSDFDLDEFRRCSELDGRRFNMLFGADEMLLEGLMAGADGAVGSTYNFAAPLYNRIIAAWESGDADTARRRQQRAVRMIEAVIRHAHLPGLKAAMALMGPDCGPPRLPLRALEPGQIEQMRRELEALGLLGESGPAEPPTT